MGSLNSGTQTTFTLSLTDSVDPAPAGNNFTYTAAVTNTGAFTATNASVVVTLDSSLTYVSASGTGWTCGASGQVVTCTRASLGTGAAPAITITVTAGNGAGLITSTAAVIADNANEVDANQGTTVTKLTQTVTVTDSADPVITGGDAFSYTVQVHNSGLSGSGTAKNLSCAVTLDSSLSYVSSSGTGWSIGVSGQVVTATISTLAVGDANPITINVTTGGAALTAATSAALTADNATTANGSQNTTVNLIDKDATAGIYFPSSSTQWTNFIARKGLSVSVPDSLYLLQETAGNDATDTIGGITLTHSGTGSTYQTTVSGYSRKAITQTDGSTFQLRSSSGSLPNINTTSLTVFTVVLMPSSAPAAVRNVISMGGSGATRCALELNTTPRLRADSTTTNLQAAASNPTGSNTVRPVALKCDRTNNVVTGYSDQEKFTPTFGSTMTGQQLTLCSNGAGGIAGGYLYAVAWFGAHAEISDANQKSLWQAMGYSPAF
jgi:uncharacterized repeat protein (TIGR01451 family)